MKMKIFRMVQKQYAIVGITSPNQSTENSSFNTRIISGFLLFGYLIHAQFMYIFRVANSFLEFIDGICSTFSTFMIIVCFVAIVFRRTTLFECIDNVQEFIDASKSFLRYFQKIQKIQLNQGKSNEITSNQNQN